MIRKIFFFLPWIWVQLNDNDRRVLVSVFWWFVIVMGLAFTGHYVAAFYSFMVPIVMMAILLLIALIGDSWARYSNEYRTPQEKIVDRLKGNF